MAAKFELVSRFKDSGLKLPVRKTKYSAGYDLTVAENTYVPAYKSELKTLSKCCHPLSTFYLDELADITKENEIRPTLVSTGLKCKLDPGTYLELSLRSSTPLKYWLVLANSVGVIDADYYNNPDNEGEIFLQVINLSSNGIMLEKGDVIGQGIIKPYLITEDDNPLGERVGGMGSTG